MAKTTALFDETTRRKLEQLMLIASKVRSGAIKGDRRSVKRGTSIEFADYRNYTQGDDLRRLDWNLYARTERPYIKLFEDEEDLAVHLLLDTSLSMDFPRDVEDPDLHKFTYARRLMAGLATVSLTTNDRLQMTAVSAGEVQRFGPARGRAYSVRMFQYVGGLQPSGETDLNGALETYARRERRPGLVMIISDMFSPSGFMEGLNALSAKGHEVAVLHVLAPEEVEPPLAGDLRLVDAETGEAQEVTIDAGMRDIYIKRLAAWRDEIRKTCRKRNIHYLPLQTDIPWERVILQDLRRLGLVR